MIFFSGMGALRRFFSVLPVFVNLQGGLARALRDLVRRFYFFGLRGLKELLLDLEHLRELRSGHGTSELSREITGLLRLKDDWVRGPEVASPLVKGYVVWAPDYAGHSAGVRCLYMLVHDLNQLGYPAYVVGSVRASPTHLAPVVTIAEAKSLVDSGFIAVYPETVVGNPLGAIHVARWVLNVPGYLGGERRYSDSEAVFYYANGYLPYIENRVAGKLHLPTIDEEIFFNDGKPYESRSLECYYVGKGRYQEGFLNPAVAIEITRSTPAKRDLGELFRASRVLYCFDSTTILAYEAALCGCPVVIVSDGMQSRKDYETGELGLVGIAWGVEELGDAVKTMHELPLKYEKVKEDYRLQLAEFVRLTQNLK